MAVTLSSDDDEEPNEGDGDGDGNGDGVGDGDGDGDGDSEPEIDIDVPDNDPVRLQVEKLYKERTDPTTNQPYREYVRVLQRKRQLSWRFPHSLLGEKEGEANARPVDAANNEPAAHLGGQEIFFHQPELISHQKPNCPVCESRPITFQRLGSTGSPYRHVVPSGFVCCAQYKFAEGCKGDGCATKWKAKTGSLNMWSYQPEIYLQQPASARATIEKEIVVRGQGTAFKADWSDAFQHCHGAGVGFTKIEKMIAAVNGQRFDRSLVACRKFRSAQTQTALLPDPIVLVEEPLAKFGYKNVRASTVKRHIEDYWYQHSYDWIRLYLQGGPFNFVSNDRHYKLTKWFSEQGQRIMTSMSSAVETQFNIVLLTIYNENETHGQTGEVWKILGNRQKMFTENHGGEHSCYGISLKYEGKYSDNVPFSGPNWEEDTPFGLLRVYCDMPEVEECDAFDITLTHLSSLASTGAVSRGSSCCLMPRPC